MKTQYMLWIFVFFLVITGVHSLTLDNLVTYHQFEDDLDDDYASIDFTNYSCGYTTGIRGQGYYIANCYGKTTLTTNLSTDNFTLSVWLKGNSQGSWNYPFFYGETSPYRWYMLETGSAQGYIFNWVLTDADESTDTITGSNPSENVFHHLVLKKDGTNCTIFLDNAVAGNGGCPASLNADVNFYLGWVTDKPNTVIMDELSWWNVAISETDIDMLYNSSNAFDLLTLVGGGGEPDTPTLVINHNLANTSNINDASSLFTYNGTITNTNVTFNCSILLDGVVNQTDLNINISQMQDFNVSWGEVEHNFSVNITCSNDEVSASTSLSYYAVDRINPVIGLMTPVNLNNTNFAEGSTLTLKFNFSDTNLFAYNITLFDSNGDVWNSENYFTENLTGTYYENETARVLSTTGNYSVRAEVWDSHTALSISDYDIKQIDKGVELDKDFVLKGENIKNFNLLKLDDRYVFDIEFETGISTVVMNLTGEGWIYLSDSKYKGHFVNLKLNKWLDFEEYDNNLGSIDVSREEDGYRINLGFKDIIKEVKFNSIGDLNYVSRTYYFKVFDESIIYLQEINQTTHRIEDNMVEKGDIMIFIAFLPLLIGFMLLVGSAMLGDDHIPMKIFLFVLAMVTPVISFQYGIEVINYYESSFSDIISDIGVHATIGAVAFVIIFIYFVLYSVVKFTSYLSRQKQERLRY